MLLVHLVRLKRQLERQGVFLNSLEEERDRRLVVVSRLKYTLV